jgi:hypothetical protein
LLGNEHRDVAGSLQNLALVLWDEKKLAEAEPLIRECLAIREKNLRDDWRTFDAKSMLGGILLSQTEHTEAEPLLLAGYEGMKEREGKIPADGKPHLKESLQRLVQLYEATAQSEKLAKWKKRLEEFGQFSPEAQPADQPVSPRQQKEQ